MSEPIFSIRIDDQGKEHTIISLFNRGGLAGQLTILSADAAKFLHRVAGTNSIEYRRDQQIRYLEECESERSAGYLIDARIVAGMICKKCGLVGLNYEQRFEKHVYHAIAYCPVCGAEVEF